MEYEICDLQDIPDGSAKGFCVETAGGEREILIVRKQGRIHGYLNRCPHTGVNLEWKPDHFLDNSGQLIQCSTHGARFRIEDGYCIHGPCRGDSLQSLTIRFSGGRIWLVTGG